MYYVRGNALIQSIVVIFYYVHVYKEGFVRGIQAQKQP